VLEQGVGPVQQAGQVRADGDQVAPHRVGEEHVVEAGRAVDLSGVEVEQLGRVGHAVGGEPAILLLGDVQDRNERRPRLGIEGDELARPLDVFSRQPGHQRRYATRERSIGRTLARPPPSRPACIAPG
jgi:hypothetical protein